MATVELEKVEHKKGKANNTKATFAKLMSLCASSVHMPPAQLYTLQAAAVVQDRSSAKYQCLSWDA